MLGSLFDSIFNPQLKWKLFSVIKIFEKKNFFFVTLKSIISLGLFPLSCLDLCSLNLRQWLRSVYNFFCNELVNLEFHIFILILATFFFYYRHYRIKHGSFLIVTHRVHVIYNWVQLGDIVWSTGTVGKIPFLGDFAFHYLFVHNLVFGCTVSCHINLKCKKIWK